MYNSSCISVEQGVIGSRVTIELMQWLYIFYFKMRRTLIAEKEGPFLHMQSFHLMLRHYLLSHHIGEL